MEPIDPNALLTVAQVYQRYKIKPSTLRRWVLLRRITPMRVKLGRGEAGSDLRFIVADLLDAIQYSQEEPGSRRRID